MGSGNGVDSFVPRQPQRSDSPNNYPLQLVIHAWALHSDITIFMGMKARVLWVVMNQFCSRLDDKVNIIGGVRHRGDHIRRSPRAHCRLFQSSDEESRARLLEIIWMVSYRNLKLRTDQWDSFRSFDLRFFKYLDPCFTAIGLEYWWGQRVGDRGRKLVQLCQHAS